MMDSMNPKLVLVGTYHRLQINQLYLNLRLKNHFKFHHYNNKTSFKYFSMNPNIF